MIAAESQMENTLANSITGWAATRSFVITHAQSRLAARHAIPKRGDCHPEFYWLRVVRRHVDPRFHDRRAFKFIVAYAASDPTNTDARR